MDQESTGRIGLMAIQPEFSQAILAGTKRVEFRKRALADDIEHVLIYESSPTQRVVGAFKIDCAVKASPADLWREYGRVGSIDETRFAAYYGDTISGVALLLSDVQTFDAPLTLDELPSQPSIPQSFVYLPARDLEAALEGQRPSAPCQKGLVPRLLELVAG